MNGIIRPAGPQDMGAVNALLRQVLKVHHDGRPDLFREEGKKYTDARAFYESLGLVPQYTSMELIVK